MPEQSHHNLLHTSFFSSSKSDAIFQPDTSNRDHYFKSRSVDGFDNDNVHSGNIGDDDDDYDDDDDDDDDDEFDPDPFDHFSSSPSISDDEIDDSLVYCLRTFNASVEGQANATKGDHMVLLNDSDSYWWLVRRVKDATVGYLPAEDIETPSERLARLNKHRNGNIAMDSEDSDEDNNLLQETPPRKVSHSRNVVFSSPVYISHSEFEYSGHEEEDEDEEEGEGEGEDGDDNGDEDEDEIYDKDHDNISRELASDSVDKTAGSDPSLQKSSSTWSRKTRKSHSASSSSSSSSSSSGSTIPTPEKHHHHSASADFATRLKSRFRARPSDESLQSTLDSSPPRRTSLSSQKSSNESLDDLSPQHKHGKGLLNAIFKSKKRKGSNSSTSSSSKTRNKFADEHKGLLENPLTDPSFQTMSPGPFASPGAGLMSPSGFDDAITREKRPSGVYPIATTLTTTTTTTTTAAPAAPATVTKPIVSSPDKIDLNQAIFKGNHEIPITPEIQQDPLPKPHLPSVECSPFSIGFESPGPAATTNRLADATTTTSSTPSLLSDSNDNSPQASSSDEIVGSVTTTLNRLDIKLQEMLDEWRKREKLYQF